MSREILIMIARLQVLFVITLAPSLNSCSTLWLGNMDSVAFHCSFDRSSMFELTMTGCNEFLKRSAPLSRA